MSNPTRYDLQQGDDDSAEMIVSQKGYYVSYDDYYDLEREVDKLRSAVDTARDILDV